MIFIRVRFIAYKILEFEVFAIGKYDLQNRWTRISNVFDEFELVISQRKAEEFGKRKLTENIDVEAYIASPGEQSLKKKKKSKRSKAGE